jgi:hypothetical protein
MRRRQPTEIGACFKEHFAEVSEACKDSLLLAKLGRESEPFAEVFWLRPCRNSKTTIDGQEGHPGPRSALAAPWFF